MCLETFGEENVKQKFNNIQGVFQFWDKGLSTPECPMFPLPSSNKTLMNSYLGSQEYQASAGEKGSQLEMITNLAWNMLIAILGDIQNSAR